ncbi:MAG TPA: pyruvate formate lyase family protein [Candidatus Bathyarchaeia archaeon]|nr:pyruvate formate lyase family protein [Candidatus Bathyarchaeia archaeon]
MTKTVENESSFCKTPLTKPIFSVAEPHDLSPRAQWLRDYYFLGVEREWNNEYVALTTGAPWGDRIWNEGDYYIVPDVYAFIGMKTKGLFNMSLELMAKKMDVPEGFWNLSLPERRAIFFQEAMLNSIPQEIISENDLLAGGRFNTQLSKCLNEKEYMKFEKENLKNRHMIFDYHKNGFGNLGATGGHLIADYKLIVDKGFKFVFEKAKQTYEKLSEKEKTGPKGKELRAMMISAEIPRKLAKKYAEECHRLILETKSEKRKEELRQMAENLERVPWEPAQTFWQGLQAVWLTHMLIIAEESYPGPGTSLGRIDQYLWPLYNKDVLIEKTLDIELAKDLFSSFIFHCNTAYDAQIKIGNQGITAGFGQLMTLSGMGPNGEDRTNEFTYMILDVFDKWAPILEPKPNVRLHRGTPERLYEVIIDMVTRAQGAPFILNFDERSMAGLVLEGIPEDEVWDYGCVGCLENTMCGNDRSGTVNCNPNLAKSIELTLWNGKNIPGFNRPTKATKQVGPKTGKAEKFATWDEFFAAWKNQIAFLVQHTVETYNVTEMTRAKYLPTPYLSLLVDDCVEKGIDIRQGPPKYAFITIEGVAFATTVDSLLAIKHFVYDKKEYTIAEIKQALQNNFQSKKEYEIIRAKLANKAPKYGNDEEEADNLAKKIMDIWANETWKYSTPTGYQFRPGMLSWNYWAGNDAFYTPATPNGRYAKTFLSNAICPTSGADHKGPTAVTNSVGVALGGKDDEGNYQNALPNGASHTISFNPSILRDKEHREKFKAYLKGYVENGGTALQINMINAEMLKDAQKHPQNYSNLLVRVTGYNAYFTSIGKELQDEIIARESHKM